MSTDFYKTSQNKKKSNFTENSPVGSALINADRRRDIHDEGNTRFKGLGKRTQKFYILPTD